MKFKAEIDVMPLKSLLDPQGKAVSASMKNVGLAENSWNIASWYDLNFSIYQITLIYLIQKICIKNWVRKTSAHLSFGAMQMKLFR